jgi:hypothetical protein
LKKQLDLSPIRVTMPSLYLRFIDNERRFKTYAAGYLAKNHPELEPIKGQPVNMVIECKVKDGVYDRFKEI